MTKSKQSTENGVLKMRNNPVHILLEHRANKAAGSVVAVTGCKREIAVIILGKKLEAMNRVTTNKSKVTCKKCMNK